MVSFRPLTVFTAIISTLLVTLGAVSSSAATGIMTDEQLDHWLANTDAELKFIGEKSYVPGTLRKRGEKSTRLVTCTTANGSNCGGSCSVYNGNAACLNVAGTVCIQASGPVAFCSKANCADPCTQLANCLAWMNDGFCGTPDTNSIIVPFT
ncbi:hypothetical protein NMY22_g7362 [Coprinellus aureogranulatus]|nr:hypothetical protein NMY22_g10252 [Coprinellus aureogranulatus]KAJ3533359.1 hypothetical protein NMY22_g7362 [Coprinellus aureogranulatus]